MLTPRHLATIRAALLFWQEEMCPHGAPAMQPYLEPPNAQLLTPDELSHLRASLATGIRFAVYDPAGGQLAGADLFSDYEEAELAAGRLSVATVIVPPPVTAFG